MCGHVYTWVQKRAWQCTRRVIFLRLLALWACRFSLIAIAASTSCSSRSSSSPSNITMCQSAWSSPSGGAHFTRQPSVYRLEPCPRTNFLVTISPIHAWPSSPLPRSPRTALDPCRSSTNCMTTQMHAFIDQHILREKQRCAQGPVLTFAHNALISPDHNVPVPILLVTAAQQVPIAGRDVNHPH